MDDGALNFLHLEVVNRGRDALVEWLKDNGDERVRLAGAALTGIDLSSRQGSKVILRGCDFAGANLRKANLNGVDLGPRIRCRDEASLDEVLAAGASTFSTVSSSLRGAKLTYASLKESDLRYASLEGASAIKVDFSGANMMGVNMSGANIMLSKLDGAVLVSARMQGVKAQGCSMHGVVLRGADIVGADFRLAKGFILDGNDMSGVLMSPFSKDPWSYLRRRYTGFMAASHVVLAAVACAPFLARAVLSYVPSASEYRRLYIVMGLHEGWYVAVLTCGIVLYNAFRLVATRSLSLLREEEVRSGHAPWKRDYWLYWWLDRWLMRWVEIVVVVVAICRTCAWLLERAGLPG